jgi:penicillin-binding protein 1A
MAWSLVRLGLVIGIWGAIAGLIGVAWVARDLPNPDRLKAANPHPSIQILAADGEPLAVRGDAYGAALDFDDLPPHLIQALIATEDRRFYSHPGFDVIGVVRSLVANMIRGHSAQGGSTLTQQLARNLFLNPKKTLERKVQELLMAVWLERRFSKNELLMLYLNRMYFGAGAYGIEAAAQTYFAKSARALNLAESAMTMGLVQSPSRLSPVQRLDRARQRASIVLDNMVDVGFIDKAQADAAKANPATPVPRAAVRGPNYFVDYIFDRLPDLVGEIDGDIIVHTTLDAKLQRLGEDAVTAGLDSDGAKLHVGQAALVALSPDGAIRAMVGGRSYAQSPFNRATDAHRQPGSAFKPFVYLAGLEVGLTPDTIMDDSPITVGKWSPQNYTRKYLGPIPIRRAVAESVNTIAVRVFQEAGAKRVVQTAHRLGITSDLHRDASLALGTGEVGLLELTGAYAPFANGGEGVTPYAVSRIVSPTGDIYYQYQSGTQGPVIGGTHLEQMVSMLEGVLTVGSGKAARLPDRPVAGKTGTTSSYRDAWFMGFTADLVCGVWTGNDDDSEMKKVVGGGLPASIWRKFMEPAHRGIPAHLIPIRSRLPLEEEMASTSEQPDLSPEDAARIAREAAMMEEADAEASDTAANSPPGQRR